METLFILRDSKGDPVLPRVSKRRRESMKCENCAVRKRIPRKYPYRFWTMKRLYVREKNEWKPVGWHCKRCGSVVLDELIKSAYLTVPNPVLKIKRIRII
jgi:hypothetical protein